MNKRRKQSIWLRRNLPLLIAAAALVLLVLIIVLVARGCSKGSDTVIRAKAFSTGTTIELPLSAELNESDFVSYGGYQFTTKKKLSALSKLITKNNEGITAETYTNSYGECGVYTKTNESGGTDSWCLYVKDPKNTNEKWYFFMGEHREIALDSGTLDLLLPLHLITDASLRDTMFAAVQPVRAKNNAGALADPVRSLQAGNAVVVVCFFLGHILPPAAEAANSPIYKSYFNAKISVWQEPDGDREKMFFRGKKLQAAGPP